MLACVAGAACSGGNRLDPDAAQRMIQEHPRFRAPQTIRVPSRYCGIPPILDARAMADDPFHIRALESNQVITVEHRPAADNECRGLREANREVFLIGLRDVAQTFHPMPLSNDRGWEFAAARRRFIAVRDVTYGTDDPPTIAHVGYAWQWVPELIGQLLQVVDDTQLGASATFRRTSDGWVVVQPGM
jgi:hypothetical protein